MNEKEEHSSESFGEYLQKERKMRGVTLEEISRATNINMRLLEAVESDKHDVMPADVFVKGFLRSYAKCIGIDPNEVLLAYTEHKGTLESSLPSDKDIDFIEKDNKRSSFILTFTVIGIFAAVLLVSFYFKGSDSPAPVSIEEKVEKIEENESKEIQPEETAKVNEEVNVPEKEIQPAVVPEPVVSTPVPKKVLYAAKVINLTLTLYASEDVWLRVGIDEMDVKEALMHEGEQIVYKAESSFLLTLGNLKGTIVSLNGEELMLPENSNNVLREFKITEELLNNEGE